MMKVAIATDTNSGMTQEKAREQGIYLLPMPVIVDDKMYLEGMDITSAQLYQAMHLHQDISSSQPSPGQLLEFWDSILQDGYDEIVYIPMSSGLSNSCQNAIQFSLEYEGRVQVVDNHRISVTQETSAQSARKLAQQGLCAREIRDYLATGELPPRPSKEEVRDMMLRHTRMEIEYKGEYTGIREMRKHISWYTAGYPNSAKLRGCINEVESYQKLEEMLMERF